MKEVSPKKGKLPAYFHKPGTITGLILVVVLAVGAILVLTLGDRLVTFTGVIPVDGSGAKLTLSPSTQTLTVNQQFDVVVKIDSGTEAGGAKVLLSTVGAYLTFDKTKLQAITVTAPDPATSFDQIVEDNVDGPNGRYDNTNGKINITAAEFGNVGVGGASLTVATVTFKALATTTTATALNFDYIANNNPSNKSIAVTFNTAGDAIDILDAVTNGSYTVNAPAPTAAPTVTNKNTAGISDKLTFGFTSVANATEYWYQVKQDGTIITGPTKLTVAPGTDAVVDSTVFKLINGKTYKVEVQGRNTSGSGPFSTNDVGIKVRSGNLNRSSNGKVDIIDLGLFGADNGKTGYVNSSTNNMADIDNSGTVNAIDLSYLARDFQF